MFEKVTKSIETSYQDFDNSFRTGTIRNIIGVDEAGRGPLAGPVTAAAVMFDSEIELNPLIRDSKKLSATQREKAYAWIVENAVSYHISSLGIQKINELNILNATLKTMYKAVKSLNIIPDLVLIDGNKIPKNLKNAKSIVQGDRKSFSIAAASILAKVYRDRIMIRWAEIFPGYALEKHKGYGTRAHFEAIAEKYPLPIHRLGYSPIKDFQFPDFPNRQKLGTWGENWAIYFMILKGYKFLERNVFIGKFGEIDAIFRKEELYVLLEVKTSGPRDTIDPVEWVTKEKIEKMRNTSEHYFLKKKIKEYDVRFDAITVRSEHWKQPHIEHYEDILY